MSEAAGPRALPAAPDTAPAAAPAAGETFDVIVVGAGAAGLTAATVAAAEGQRVLLAEGSPYVGGTTAISGGMVWIPANHLMAEAGRPDTLEAARAYLAATVPPEPDPAAAAALETFVTRGDEALRYLQARTSLRLRPVMAYPDYYPRLPGATPGGRVLEPMPFDARSLNRWGKWFDALRPPLPEFLLFGGMMVHRSDIPHLRRASKSAASAWHVGQLLLRHAFERLLAPRGTTLHLGNALAGWLLRSALEMGVDIRTGTAVRRLRREGDAGRIAGVELVAGGRRWTALARRGVILASGGLSHDAELRQRYVPAAVGDLTATVNGRAPKSGAALAQAVGAQLSRGTLRQGLWVPGSVFTRADGSRGVYPHTVTDRGKPGLIAVDRQGRRFVNEAVSYHAFVLGQLAAGPQAVPAWLVVDGRFLWRYGLGSLRPFARKAVVEAQVASGYLRRGDTLAELARAIGIAPAGALEETVLAFNAGAREGLDRQFGGEGGDSAGGAEVNVGSTGQSGQSGPNGAGGRGSDIYQRHLGDAEHGGPNPCVAPIETPPFYAVAVRPADLGIAAGIVTDADARVLDDEGRPIPGLYACGNDMQSVMNGAYPGPGITLGPALVFGYVAGRGVAGKG